MDDEILARCREYLRKSKTVLQAQDLAKKEGFSPEPGMWLLAVVLYGSDKVKIIE